MNWLYDTTLRDTKGFSRSKTLKYINLYWFNNYFRVIDHFAKTKVDRVSYEGPNILLGTGRPTREKIIQDCLDIIKECPNMDRQLMLNHLVTAPKTDGEITIPPKRFLTNVSLSCALDSLLSIMFFASGGYFMARVAQSNPREPPRWLRRHRDQFKEMSQIVKDRLFDLYDRIDWKGVTVRELQQDLALFIEEDCRDIKVVYEIWGVMATMFDGLTFERQTEREHDIGNDPVETYALEISADPILPFDLYIKPYHLVYVNDVFVGEMDYRNIALAETIGNEYKLVGVVNHTGAHYISKILVEDQWYAYDDLNGYIVRYDEDVLLQTKRSKIVMMFYVKM